MFSQTPCLKRFSGLAFLLMSVLSCVFYFADISMLDLSSGFSHPLEGWDHVVTMLGVGIWAAQLRGKAIWLLPTTFVSVMSLGGISGASKYLAVPSAEILIVLSCLVFSILIIRKVRFDIKINVLIVAFFAFFHGYAHGQEISTSASLISYTAGFMIATLLLHSAGILVAKVILLSITFCIAQALNVAISNESTKTATAIYKQVAKTVEQIEIQSIEKLSAIKLPQIFIYLPIFEPLKTYFVLCLFLIVFLISQFICYVFYPKQRADFLKFLARCFKNSFYSCALPLTLSRLNQFFFSNFQHFKGIFMRIRLSKINVARLFSALFLLSPSFAHAHSMVFTAIDFNSGFLHPLQGIDHIVAMLAVGFLAAQRRGVDMLVLPLTFVSVMALGGFMGTSGFTFDYAETIILLSVFVLSVLAVKNVQFDLKITSLIVGFFALFHGFAHGAEIAESADLLSYSVGFILATLLLHLTGILMARSIRTVAVKSI
jgi:hydrogenase/urease accessory protein HupE